MPRQLNYRVFALISMDVAALHSLNSLPLDILGLIVRYLSFSQSKQLSCVSRRFRRHVPLLTESVKLQLVKNNLYGIYLSKCLNLKSLSIFGVLPHPKHVQHLTKITKLTLYYDHILIDAKKEWIEKLKVAKTKYISSMLELIDWIVSLPQLQDFTFFYNLFSDEVVSRILRKSSLLRVGNKIPLHIVNDVSESLESLEIVRGQIHKQIQRATLRDLTRRMSGAPETMEEQFNISRLTNLTFLKLREDCVELYPSIKDLPKLRELIVSETCITEELVALPITRLSIRALRTPNFSLLNKCTTLKYLYVNLCGNHYTLLEPLLQHPNVETMKVAMRNHGVRCQRPIKYIHTIKELLNDLACIHNAAATAAWVTADEYMDSIAEDSDRLSDEIVDNASEAL